MRASQFPVVGRALNWQGQPQAQLQLPISSPAIRHSVPVAALIRHPPVWPISGRLYRAASRPVAGLVAQSTTRYNSGAAKEAGKCPRVTFAPDRDAEPPARQGLWSTVSASTSREIVP